MPSSGIFHLRFDLIRCNEPDHRSVIAYDNSIVEQIPLSWVIVFPSTKLYASPKNVSS